MVGPAPRAAASSCCSPGGTRCAAHAQMHTRFNSQPAASLRQTGARRQRPGAAPAEAVVTPALRLSPSRHVHLLQPRRDAEPYHRDERHDCRDDRDHDEDLGHEDREAHRHARHTASRIEQRPTALWHADLDEKPMTAGATREQNPGLRARGRSDHRHVVGAKAPLGSIAEKT